jgi:hypothetical protein
MTDMRKSRYTEEQITGFIKQAEAGKLLALDYARMARVVKA